METYKRIRLEIEGIVQGVGFRPFIYRLARRQRLAGWVMNTPSGVVVEVQGQANVLNGFVDSIPKEAPPLAVINTIAVKEKKPITATDFIIKESDGHGSAVQIAPDLGICPDCTQELFDPHDRRYRYPFINCTNCGPRFTIVKDIPYDRKFTTMASFGMCDACRSEYLDPTNRRFHAQPNACPSCGPTLSLLDANGNVLAGDPVLTTIGLLKEGKIMAVKGLGGYHLAVDACNMKAVQELRRRKRRDHKPFALMSPDPETIGSYARFDEPEEKLLTGPESPIVLLRKGYSDCISPLVAPDNGYFGVMLPYTPLHHLILRDHFTALVMTSANMCDEPITYRHDEAFDRLRDLTDFFITHDRDIHTGADDSVVRVFRGSPIFLRRSRGYAPRAISVPDSKCSVLAVGAELKGVACLTRDDKAFLSQHIGDLQNPATLISMEETVSHMKRILRIEPQVVAHDLHPDYLSTHYALAADRLPKIAVQHHHAHLASCMAENGLDGEVIGVILDGTGYGLDGTIWGGEFLIGGYTAIERSGHFRMLPIPGGDAAVKEPYRMALSYLYDTFGEDAFNLPLACVQQVDFDDRPLFLKMLQGGINAPLTSSCGRLFDAVAALIGLRTTVSYEGQAAIELEALAEASDRGCAYPYDISASGEAVVCDFRPMIREIVEDVGRKRNGEISRTFHNTLAAAIMEVCAMIGGRTGMDRVVLSGGVFQNKLLTEKTYALLAENGFHVFTHRLAPPNDGGIALGQAVVAGRRLSCA